MNVLMITGDKMFGPGHPRYDLQRSAVDRLEVIYFSRGNLFPKIPKGPFNVVTAQDPFIRGHLAFHLAWFLHAKLNIQVHTDLSAYSSLKRWWAGYNLRKADSVRVVSEKIKQQVLNLGVKVPVTVLPIYLDLESFRSIKRKQHEGKTILWIGRFEEEKNPRGAINILKEMRERGIDAKLIFLGSGSLEPTLQTLAEGLPVEFPGWHSPERYLETADLVLSTSLHESWGASTVEALAAGIPVVAPDVGVARKAGAIVVPRDKLADAVIDVVTSGTRGELKIKLLDKEEWTAAWRNALI